MKTRLSKNRKTVTGLAALTSAENAVLKELCSGSSVAEIAKTRDTSVNTVRSQLKSIYRKTGTHRQAELVSQTLASERSKI